WQKQNPRNTRWNGLPPADIDGLLVMCHEHATHAPGELLEVGKTAAGPHLVLQHTPEACHGMEMVAASGWQKLPPQSRLPISQRRCARVRAVDNPAVDDPHDRFPAGATRGHHVMAVVPKPLGIPLRDEHRDDLGCPIVDRTDDTEPSSTGDP